MKSSLLDFRFGWRWLLPLYAPHQTISLAGFDESEHAYWQKEDSIGLWEQRFRQTDGCIINADKYPKWVPAGYSSFVGDQTQWVAIIGSRASVASWRKYLYGFPHIREYGLVPSTNPRVVIPLTEPHHVFNALTLHKPGRRIARLGVRLARLLARINIYIPLRRRMLLIASRSCISHLGAVHTGMLTHLNGIASDYALYLGTPDENRKTVILPLGELTSDWLIKVGSSDKARSALHNEAFALHFLSDTPVKNRVPRIKDFLDNQHCVALFQEYRHRSSTSSKKYTDMVIDFLAHLSQLGRQTRPLRVVMDEMLSDEIICSKCGKDEAYSLVWRWLRRKAESGAAVWECYSHGDLAPWNCMWTEKGLFVYDWEESCPRRLAFTDVFYFVVAPLMHLSSEASTPEATIAKALKLADRVARDANLPCEEIEIHFTLWLLLNWERHPIVPQLAKMSFYKFIKEI